jgi:hypothetical protein
MDPSSLQLEIAIDSNHLWGVDRGLTSTLGVSFLTGARLSQPAGVAPPLRGLPSIWIGLGRMEDGYCA